jgi:hypothetical protein
MPLRHLPTLALSLLLAGVACAEDPPKPAPLALGERLAAFTATDAQGGTFRLADLAMTRPAVEAEARRAAVAFGGAKDLPLTTRVDALPGVKEEGGAAVDPRLRRLFVAEVGRPFGLQVTEEGAARFATLKDVVEWVWSARSAPVLLVAWSPKCPTSRTLTGRIVDTSAATGVRVFALAVNYNDSDEKIAEFVDEFDFRIRILLDRSQAVADRLGAQRTPHFFLLDSGLALRYRGGLDNDTAGTKEPAQVAHWLRDAIEALKAGKEIPLCETEPDG